MTEYKLVVVGGKLPVIFHLTREITGFSFFSLSRRQLVAWAKAP